MAAVQAHRRLAEDERIVFPHKEEARFSKPRGEKGEGDNVRRRVRERHWRRPPRNSSSPPDLRSPSPELKKPPESAIESHGEDEGGGVAPIWNFMRREAERRRRWRPPLSFGADLEAQCRNGGGGNMTAVRFKSAVFFFFWFICVSPFLVKSLSHSLNDDVLGLIVFKLIFEILHDYSPCNNWIGVKCNPRSNRVSDLVLDGFGLSGKLGNREVRKNIWWRNNS